MLKIYVPNWKKFFNFNEKLLIQGVSIKTQPDVPSRIPTAHRDHNVRFLLQRVPNNERSILWLVEVWASYQNVV